MSGNISRSNNHPAMLSADDTTTVITAANTSVSNHLSRVTRPLNTRRRSRASRRAPTTLLNTDTTNFRAMVQRFTGGGNNDAGSTSAPVRSNESTVAYSQPFFNTYNSNLSSFSDGFGSISTRDDSYNVEFTQPHSHNYFTTTADLGGSDTAGDGDGDDQHVGFRPRGSYNW